MTRDRALLLNENEIEYLTAVLLDNRMMSDSYHVKTRKKMDTKEEQEVFDDIENSLFRMVESAWLLNQPPKEGFKG